MLASSVARRRGWLPLAVARLTVPASCRSAEALSATSSTRTPQPASTPRRRFSSLPSSSTTRVASASHSFATFTGAPTASDTTERAIDAEVQQIVQQAYTVCYNTLRANRELLDKVVYDLLDKETIDTADMTKLTDEYGVKLSAEEMLETLELPVAA